MRQLKVWAIVGLMLGASVSAGAADAPWLAPIQKFVDSFNKGDMAAAAATHVATAELVIIDEVPPYHWAGPQAFQSWAADLERDAKKNGLTDQAVTLGTPTRIEWSGEQAYVVVPAVYTFKQVGIAMREAAQMTFVVKKGTSGWLIQGWTWTGPKPEPVASAKP